MSQPSENDQIHIAYQQRQQAYSARIAELDRSDRRLARRRGFTFLAGLFGFFMAYQQPAARVIWISLGVLLMIAFLCLAVYQETLQRQLERVRLLNRTVLGQLARIRRDWQHVPRADVVVPARHREVARDLDLFGHASLFQLVNQAYTPRGRATLRDWILEPASPGDIAMRQSAIRALVDCEELREELVLRGCLLAGSLAGPDAFVQWAEQPGLLATRRWLVHLARVTPCAFLVALGGLAIGWLTPTQASVVAVGTLLVNVLASVPFTGRVHDIFNRISTRSGELQHYRTLFQLIAQLPPGGPLLTAIRHAAIEEQRGAVHQLASLRGIMALAGLRHAGLLSILYVVLQLTVLWDVHVLWLLERWQRRSGGFARGWFESLGQLEAVGSLACLAHDNPAWCFPSLRRDGPAGVIANQLGHPLLAGAARVCNDVQLGPPGTVLLVTGSNMSGKSTLLRSIGVNVLLAQSGAPVCATSMELTPTTVTTSMRIQDSLENGVSFFMAELQRLKAIVDQATAYATRPDRTLLFLLDEILQGTNSVERHMAVVRVLSHLMDAGALGAVSTHDLDLARCEELKDQCQIVHFRETLHGGPQGGQSMAFDYKLHAGVATTTNAMKLLKLVGLD